MSEVAGALDTKEVAIVGQPVKRPTITQLVKQRRMEQAMSFLAMNDGGVHQPQERNMMSDEALKPGDVVRLKSGGPNMTVESIEEINAATSLKGQRRKLSCHCAWFEVATLRHGGFYMESLEIASLDK